MMTEVEIIECDVYNNYILKDKKNKKYCISINFIGINKPLLHTILYVKEQLLIDGLVLNYGLPKKNAFIKKDELLIMKYNEKILYLQRMYG